MTRGRWKAIERWWALQLGGRRIPVTGRHSGDVPDVDHPHLAIEVKAGKVLPVRLRDGMRQAKAAAARARNEGKDKTPVVCLTHSVGPGLPNEHFVLLTLDDFQALWGGPTEEVDA